jgi:cytochrome P450
MQTQPPLRRGKFLVGILPEFSDDALSFMLDVRRYGDIVLSHFGPFPVYFLNSPTLNHQVLVEDADKYYKSAVTKAVLAPAIGTGIFTSDGDFWRRQRKLMQPAFHTKRIGAYADAMTRLTDTMLAAWRDGQTLMLDEQMAHLTMAIISKILFDAEMAQDLDAIGKSITTILKRSDERFNQVPTIPYWLPTKANRELREGVATLDALIQRFIDERRRAGYEDKGDLLSMLLEAQDDDGTGMTDKQLRDEAMTVFGAGHETTAVTLTWAFYLLAQHPDVEARLHEELAQVLGGRTPTLADLPNLKYTEMVIKEAMRLFPPAWGTSREPITDVTIGGYPVKKGSTVFINIYGMHRDERYFADAEAFDPLRWLPEREAEIPKHAYIPFGGGPRVCIGNALAMMEAKLVLATIAQRFTMDVAAGHPVVPQRMFTLRPKHGMKMVLRERETQHSVTPLEMALAGD